MSTKDWVLLLIPILFNGIIVWFIGNVFERKKIKKEIKMPYYKNFSNLLKNFNITFIDENLNVQMKGKDITLSLAIFQEFVIEIIKYYDSNFLYLSDISRPYSCLLSSWREVESYIHTSGIDNRVLVAEKLNIVKDSLNQLNLKVDQIMLKI